MGKDNKIISISLPQDIVDKLQKYAKEDLRSVSSFVKKLIQEYDDKKKN